jgi:ribulose-5-phosphate 4-epimerase/fuculose-1-phosphate aldolase
MRLRKTLLLGSIYISTTSSHHTTHDTPYTPFPQPSNTSLSPTMATDTLPASLHQGLRLLIRANHILHQHNLVDAFGHISIRHPLNPDQYLIAAYDPGAPALVRSRADFIAYDVATSAPVDASAPQGYSERFIHGEILRRFPDVRCVVHSHSETVIPFSLGGAAVRPVFHMAGFLGAGGAPVFRADEAYKAIADPGIAHDMLIKNKALGRALARLFDAQTPVVLQHKHGFTAVGASVEEAVFRAIYTQTNCELLQRATALAGGRVEDVAYLSEEEARACAVMNAKTQDKSFRLWLREVQVNPLYKNSEGEPKPPPVKGMNM